MNIFEQVKECVTAKQAAEQYGIKVQRNGMACCPFHNDRHPSMKVDKNYHCFACGVGGDSIDFTARMFGLTQYEAARKLIADFGLPIQGGGKSDKGYAAKVVEPFRSERQKTTVIRAKMEQWLDWATDILIRYEKWIRFWKEFYKPEAGDEWHELFTEALGTERKIRDYLDVLLFGTGDEMIDFFKENRREVEQIEKRIEEYQRGVTDGIRRYCEGRTL